jgi:hypothetical protein
LPGSLYFISESAAEYWILSLFNLLELLIVSGSWLLQSHI